MPAPGGSGFAISAAHLDQTARAHGVEVRRGAEAAVRLPIGKHALGIGAVPGHGRALEEGAFVPLDAEPAEATWLQATPSR